MPRKVLLARQPFADGGIKALGRGGSDFCHARYCHLFLPENLTATPRSAVNPNMITLRGWACKRYEGGKRGYRHLPPRSWVLGCSNMSKRSVERSLTTGFCCV